MKNSPRTNNPHQYAYFLLRLLLGVISVCVLPALLLSEWGAWMLKDWVSVTVVALGFILSIISLRRMNSFPGQRTLFAAVPIVGGWYGVLLSALVLLHLPYNVSYLIIGFLLTTVWLVLQAYILRSAHRLVLGYVPLGRTIGIEQINGPKWIRLDTPNWPENEQIDAIVADLHAPNLTGEWQKFLAECTLQHRLVYNIRQAEESLTGRVKIHHMYENNLGSLLPSPMYMLVKYILESLLIIMSLPITMPIMIIAAILIKIEDGGSIFFNQERVGYRGKPFMMYKFRSMTENKRDNQFQTTAYGDARITRIGKFIRKVRIDELPQFFNVLKGEMALIGPRAEFKKFADELEQQVPFYQYRHIVKPGITGWAQVMHGYATGADETQIKIEHDFFYIKFFSFWLDLIIVFKTIKTMVTGFGAR